MSRLVQVAACGHLDRAGPLAGRSDLSDRMLQIFTCERPTVCFFWKPHAGANAAFFLALGELQVLREGTFVPDAPVLPLSVSGRSARIVPLTSTAPPCTTGKAATASSPLLSLGPAGC